MDFLKFGLVILILGIIILGYGAIQLGDNQPKKIENSESKTSIFGGATTLAIGWKLKVLIWEGIQYTTKRWEDLLHDHNILISMDGRGRCKDNIWIERFWRIIKQEYIYLNPTDNVE